MKIVLAPDSFKGSLTANEACEAMEKGILRVYKNANIVKIPMADGGEGTLQSLIDATGGKIHHAMVRNPIGETIRASYGILGDGKTAVIEMAEASGLNLVPERLRNPMMTTTYGTGELILAALEKGCRHFILGIGGSATNDGGAGMAQALGAKLLDSSGREIGPGGGSLSNLHKIDISSLHPGLKECTFLVACDVDNPLCGPNGASAVFGPQKGASPSMVQQLDQNLEHLAKIIERDFGKKVKDVPGAGAAGGLGAGMLAFLDSKLKNGVDIVLEAVSFREKIQGADLIISGEGRVDFQTLRGKTPYGVAKAAKTFGIPVVLIAGSIGEGIDGLYNHGVESVFSMVNRPMSLEEAMNNAAFLLEKITEQIIRTRFPLY
jgi:glycerate 2-kinase